MSVARAALAISALALAMGLAGCNTQEKMATNAKSAQPLSPQLVSLMTEKGMSPGDPMLLRIFKEESKAEVWKKRKTDGKYALLKSYDICRFSGKLGPKIKEGDKQAPEGFYSVAPGQMNPKSSYYLSFNLGYPNAYDKALGRTGLHVMMHGDCLSAGCYAMTDAQIGEIYAMARESFRGGQPAFQVQALPFRMTAQNIARRRTDKNMPFWKNLKQGSDAFEVTRLEPKVDACGKKYVFNAQAGGLQSFNPTAGCPSYQVEPSIARAVAAKEKADNVVIAALSKTEPLAPEYIAQNGRLRRTLDQPVVMVAAVAPEAVGAQMTAARTASGGMQISAASPSQATGSVTVPAKSAAPGKVQGASPVAVANVAPAPAAADAKSEPNMLVRLFRSEETTAASPILSAQPTPAASPASQVASAKPVSTPSAGPRQISTGEQPVMATAVSPAPAQQGGAVDKLKGWVGGLWGSKSEDAGSQAAPPAEATPATYTAPPGQKKNRSASLPPQFSPKKASAEGRVSSSYATVE